MTPERGALQAVAPSPTIHQTLGYGRFTADLEVPSLRNVALDGHDVAQTITFTVRDQSWGTVDPSDIDVTVSNTDGSVRSDFTARYISAEIDLEVVGTIQLSEQSLTYSVWATALKDFLRCRIGICVLHPASLSGQPLEITTPDNTYKSQFPVDVSPDRSVTNIVSMRHGVDGQAEVLLELSGDLFEFEDQRNWADASFKTFCTPLGLPWPVQIKTGQVIEQTLRMSATSAAPASPMRRRDKPYGHTHVSIDFDGDGPVIPSIGVLSYPRPEALEAAAALGVSHVRATVDSSRDATGVTEAAFAALASTDLDLELEVVADDPATLESIRAGVNTLGEHLLDVFVFDRSTQITPMSFRPDIEQLRSTTDVRVGGGSGKNFGAINFNIDNIPLNAIDTLTFPISPQVHYTDDFSLFVNLEAQSTVAQNGRRIARGRNLSLGPITLLPRIAGEELSRDPRGNALLAAAWTVGSLSQLLSSGANALTYHEATGPAGVVEQDGTLTPTYHVLADIAMYREARVLSTSVEDCGQRISVIALRGHQETLIVVANLEAAPVVASIDLPRGAATMRILGEDTIDVARQDRPSFTATSTSWNGEDIHLAPFAIATLVVAK